MKKLLALVLTIVMVAAMAVPAFAEGHATPEIVIANESADGYYVAGSTVKYEFTIFCEYASIIKVGNKSLDITDFKDNKDGSFTYKGSYTLGLTDTNLRFYVYDMGQGTNATFEKTVKLKVDPTSPAVRVSAVTTGSAFKLGLLSIVATDNIGLAKIAVNGKTIADADDFTNKKAYVTNYEVPASGTYIVTVTDTAGNISATTVKFNSDGTTSSESITTPVGGNLWNGGYMSGLASIYKDNPQLYYYLKALQDNGEIRSDIMLWYLLSQGNLTLPENNTSSSTTTNNNWYFLYQYIMNNEDMSVADKQLYFALLSGNLDSTNANLYWYLFQNSDLDIDKNLLYYLINGSVNGSAPSLDFKENYLAYQYFFGSLVEDLEITSNTKERILTLTAPESRNGVSVSYTWKMYKDGSWKTVGSDSKTLAVEPNVGDKYKVIISSDFYFSTVESDIYTVTAADKLPDFSIPVVEEDDDDEDKFSADDITINGVINNYVRIKLGEKAILVPNVNGFWSYDTDMFSGTANTLAVLTAKKVGTSIAVFTGINSDGEKAFKSIIIEVVE